MSSESELEEIRQDYETELESLTFNSKPIITNLTVIAQENTGAASVIARTVEERIAKAPPAHKLPALYLLDSIAKNAAGVYSNLFARNLYNTFMSVFTVVDGPTRKKLEELLRLWKSPVVGSDSNEPVFPPEATRRIENALIKIRVALLQQQQRQSERAQPFTGRVSRQSMPHHGHHGGGTQGMTPSNSGSLGTFFPAMNTPNGPLSTNHPPGSGQPTSQALLQDIAALIQSSQQHLAVNPHDRDLSSRVEALTQLGKLVASANLSSQEVMNVKAQLQTLAGPPSRSTSIGGSHQPGPGMTRPGGQSAPSANINTEYQIPAPTRQNQASSLLQQLQSAGILSSNKGTPIPSLGSFPSVFVELSTASLNKPRPELVDRLFKQNNLQCSICGRRFRDTAEGSSARDRHLDWHFRINKRIRSEVARGHNRVWYPDEEEFVKLKNQSSDTIDQSEASNEVQIPTNRDSDKEKSEDKAIRDRYVNVPSDPDVANRPCPICQDEFKAEWSDEIDEWIWKNAQQVGDKIYHASCFAEAYSNAPSTDGDGQMNRQASVSSGQRVGSPANGKNSIANLLSVLGKRKAEEPTLDSGNTVKKEREG